MQYFFLNINDQRCYLIYQKILFRLRLYKIQKIFCKKFWKASKVLSFKLGISSNLLNE